MSADDIRPLRFQAARRSDPIEMVSRRELMKRYPVEHFDRMERLHFHMVMIGRRGVGVHEVDFAEVEMRPHRMLHVQPGQVHRWRVESDFDATLILFSDAPTRLSTRWQLGANWIDIDDEARSQIKPVIALVKQERSAERTPVERAVALGALRDLAFVRMGLGREQSEVADRLPTAYVAFRDDLEAGLSVAVTMGERAERLGYSARTISRACLEVSGRTAKQLVDERVVLEARRLLSQPEASVSQVGHALGFSEQTNFAKYFRRHMDMSPSAWMDTVG